MKMDVFKTAQQVNIHLGFFCKKICHQELLKIAQSGHFAHTSRGIRATAAATKTRNKKNK